MNYSSISYNGQIKILDTPNQVSIIKGMFEQSRRYIVISCPFWDEDLLSDNFLLSIYENLSRCIHVILIGKLSAVNMIRDVFHVFNHEVEDRPFLHVYFIDNFHFKLYFNDSALLISSMNMSNISNNDVGIFLLYRYNTTIEQMTIEYIANLLDDEDKEEFLSIVLPKKMEDF